MSDPIFAQLRTRIDAMESKAVREAATVILNIAATNANSVLAAHLEDALNASARVEGKIATFWSGKGENGINNHENALALQKQGLDLYLYEDTDVGQFVEKTSDYAWRTYLDHTYGEFTNLASAMMADQAKGPVIACVSGDVRTDATWFSELATLMEDQDTIVNGVPVSSLKDFAVGDGSASVLQLAHGIVSQTYKCFETFDPEGDEVPFPYAQGHKDGLWDWGDVATAVGFGALAVGVGMAAAVTAPSWATGAAATAGAGVLGLLLWDGQTSPVEASDDLSQSTLDYLHNGFATTSFSAALAQEMMYRDAYEQSAFSGVFPSDIETLFPGVSQLPITSVFMPPLGQSNVAQGGTSYDTSSYGFDIGTFFSYGNEGQGTQEFGSDFSSILNDGLLLGGGNWSVSSVTANDPGFWVEMNAAISDGFQPGRGNVMHRAKLPSKRKHGFFPKTCLLSIDSAFFST